MIRLEKYIKRHFKVTERPKKYLPIGQNEVFIKSANQRYFKNEESAMTTIFVIQLTRHQMYTFV